MKILQFDLDPYQFEQNRINLSDTIRMAMFQEAEPLFNLLEYENDDIFLEPTLFCYFLSDISPDHKISLTQSLYGYIKEELRSEEIKVKADGFGLVNLPNLGYLRLEPDSVSTINSGYIKEYLIPDTFAGKSKIRLCLHPTEHLLYQSSGVKFDETVNVSLSSHLKELDLAIAFFQNHIPDMWTLIAISTREFVVFNSPNYNSFAGIMNHGTAYFNIENSKKTSVFFIDDIAHQCGHIIFNILTLDTDIYLKVPKDYPLNRYSPNSQEGRGVYGAFHGLFTYTTILFSLDAYLDKEPNANKPLIHEVLARIGFYLRKFEYDLQLMNRAEILTEKGLYFRKQFEDGFRFILKKWKDSVKEFDYSNQPYIFQYNLFCDLNPLK